MSLAAAYFSKWAVNEQRACTVNQQPYEHCICIPARSAEPLCLWLIPPLNCTHGPTCQHDSGCSLLGNCSHSVWWAWDDSGLSVGPLTWERQAWFVILLSCRFPCRSTSTAPLACCPTTAVQASCLYCVTAFTNCALSTPECCVNFPGFLPICQNLIQGLWRALRRIYKNYIKANRHL